MAATKSAKYSHKWGPNDWHSIPLATHKANVAAKAKKAKLNAPIVPGSSVTERALAKEVGAATRLKFGALDLEQKQAVNQARNFAKDIGGPGGFYDQYLAKLGQHQTAMQNIGAVANQQMMGLQQGVTGLAGQTLQGIQAPADAQAAMGGMGPAGNLAPLASNAAAVRQALVGSFVADQTARNAAAQQYADTLTNVVGPTQKLSAQVQGRRNIATAKEKRQETAREKGDFKYTYAQGKRESETKNVIAEKTLGINAATKAAAQAETTRAHKAGEKIDWAKLRADRDKAAADANAKANKRSDSGPFAGLTAGQIAGLSDKDAKGYVDRYNAMVHPPKDGKGNGGGKVGKQLTLGQQLAGSTDATSIQDLVKRAKSGMPFKSYTPEQLKKWKKQPLDRKGAEAKLAQFLGPKAKDPWVTRAVFDSIYDGHLSAFTVKHLINAGYRPREVAAALGTKTHDDWLKTPAGQAWWNSHSQSAGGGSQRRP